MSFNRKLNKSPPVTNHNIRILKDSNSLRLEIEDVWWQWLYPVCCDSGGYCCGVAKESILLVYDAASMSSWVMMFWLNIMSSSLRSECPRKILLGHFNLWRWHHVASNRHDPLTLWHSVICQCHLPEEWLYVSCHELLSAVECKNMYSIHIYLSPPPIVLNHPTLVLFCSADWTHTKYSYQGWSWHRLPRCYCVWPD